MKRTKQGVEPEQGANMTKQRLVSYKGMAGTVWTRDIARVVVYSIYR